MSVHGASVHDHDELFCRGAIDRPELHRRHSRSVHAFGAALRWLGQRRLLHGIEHGGLPIHGVDRSSECRFMHAGGAINRPQLHRWHRAPVHHGPNHIALGQRDDLYCVGEHGLSVHRLDRVGTDDRVRGDSAVDSSQLHG
jgi:hypothetical protein